MPKDTDVEKRSPEDYPKMWTLVDASAVRTDVCGPPFCEAEPEVSFVDEWGVEVHWCRECYEEPCGRCRGRIEHDANRRKGLCQDCRDEIQMWGGDDERGIEKEPDSTQTTLITDGGKERRRAIEEVSDDALDEASFELRQVASHIGWTDEEREEEYLAICDHLQDLKTAGATPQNYADSPGTHLFEFTRCENGEVRPLREVASKMKDVAVQEWTTRTWFGKLLYPPWFAFVAFVWLLVGPLVVAVRALAAAVRLLDRSASWDGFLPSVYKECDSDE